MAVKFELAVRGLGLVTVSTVLFVTTIFVIQRQELASISSSSVPRDLYRVTQLRRGKLTISRPLECTHALTELRENLTTSLSRLGQYEEELSQLSYLNIQLETKLKELQQLYQLEHHSLMQLRNNDGSMTASSADIPTIFMITPTYTRWTQKADLVRLCQTLMHVRNLHWIVVEDVEQKTTLVTNFLKRCPVTSTHLNFRTSKRFRPRVRFRRRRRRIKTRKNQGVEQQNSALRWLRQKYTPGEVKGVVYFGDDEHTFDIEIFEEMRYTKQVAVWPVGLAGGLRFEGPECELGKVTGWHAAWGTERKFRVDFSGLAINIDAILNHSSVAIHLNSAVGYFENDFLAQLVSSKEELEAKADDCMKILVWNTFTRVPLMSWEEVLIKNGTPSNPKIES